MNERIGAVFYQSCGNMGMLNVCLCLCCGGVGGVWGEWVGVWTRVWSGGMLLCLCEL